MVYLFLADGFEEIEALTPVDYLKRLGVDILTVSIKDKVVAGAHNIKVTADITLDEMVLNSDLEAVILPGGMPGSKNLDNCKAVHEAVDFAVNNKRVVAAICAAPYILGKKGLLNGKNATCFPGFESFLEGANVLEKGVVISENIVTAKGAGVAWEFSEAIGSLLKGKAESEKVLRSTQWGQ